MEQLIPIINKLQDVVAVVDGAIDLPQIVVVGSQSAGKSSVLEAFVGRDFLPRGTGIVTRRPLELQLIPNKGNDREYGEFRHQPNKQYTNFDEIRQEIEAETVRLVGPRGISKDPIRLKIFSPHVLNLTLVDLPGLTKVSVGDQSKDVPVLIRDMVLSFSKQPNAIILAVTPANIDLANSDALNLAREVDPEGKRTIGVVTKLDLMDKGTNCLDILQNRVYNLRLGFIGVVNRSQQDINTKTSIMEARAAEADFFRTHHLYKELTNVGIPYLSKNLNMILMNHIRDTLPSLRDKVNKMLTAAKQEFFALAGDGGANQTKASLLLGILNAFAANYAATIDGNISNALATEELCGGARINFVFNDIFGAYVDGMDSLNMSRDEISAMVTNANGINSPLGIGLERKAFDQIIRQQIVTLREPSLNCVDLVFDELQRIANRIEISELNRFFNLREKILEVVNLMLNDCRGPTKEMVKDLVEIELAYINTNHPDYVGHKGIMKVQKKFVEKKEAQKAVPAAEELRRQEQLERERRQEEERRQLENSKRPEKERSERTWNFLWWQSGKDQPQSAHQSTHQRDAPMSQSSVSNQRALPTPQQKAPPGFPKQQRTEDEDFNLDLTEYTIKSYFNKVVRKNMKDRVPKTIMLLLVNKTKESIQNQLIKELYREDKLDMLLEESSDVAQKRSELEKMIKVLTAAQNVLMEVQDFRVR